MVASSGSIDLDIDELDRIILHKPQRKWRAKAQRTMRNIVDYGANSVGWMDLADIETESTPLELTGSGDEVQLTNDTSGSFSITSSLPDGVSTLWNPNTNYMNFASNGVLENDVIMIRVDYDIAPDVTPFKYKIVFDFYSEPDGGGANIFSNIIQMPHIDNDAGVFQEDVYTHHFYVGSSIISGSMAIKINGTASAQIKTNAFFVVIDRVGL